MFARESSFEKRRQLFLLAAALPLAACGGGGSGGGPVFPSSPAEPTVEPVDRFVEAAPGVRLHVRDWPSGRANGLGFVLLPGFGANAQHFNQLAAALAPRGRVLAITRRGFGRSDKPAPSAQQRYDTETLVSDVDAVLRALQMPDGFVLGGHSIAGNEVTRFAGRFPQRVRGLIYLDTSFDYTRPPELGESEPKNPLLDDPPQPSSADEASLAAAIAFKKRISRNWSAPLEADLVDGLEVQPDGRVVQATPLAVADTMYKAAHAFSPDYRALRAPALVLAAFPGDRRDMFPWLPEAIDPQLEQDVQTYLRLFERARQIDAGRLIAAVPAGSRRVDFRDSTHVDFFIERQAEVLQAIDAMGWR